MCVNTVSIWRKVCISGYWSVAIPPFSSKNASVHCSYRECAWLIIVGCVSCQILLWVSMIDYCWMCQLPNFTVSEHDWLLLDVSVAKFYCEWAWLIIVGCVSCQILLWVSMIDYCWMCQLPNFTVSEHDWLLFDVSVAKFYCEWAWLIIVWCVSCQILLWVSMIDYYLMCQWPNFTVSEHDWLLLDVSVAKF